MKYDMHAAKEATLLELTPRLRAYLHVLVECPEIVEDALQEVFLKYLARGPASGSPSPDGWLFKVARNEALNALRSDLRRRRREQAVAATSSQVVEDPSEEAARREVVRRMDAALKCLALEHREPLYLSVAEGLSVREIAQQTGVSKSTVAIRVREALVLLSRAFHTVELK